MKAERQVIHPTYSRQ